MRELLDKIETRQRLVRETAERLRGQIAELIGQLAAAERTLERLETTRENVLELATEDGSPPPEPLLPGYREILARFEQNGDELRARDVCRALGTGTEPRHTEGTRAKLKRLMKSPSSAPRRPNGCVSFTSWPPRPGPAPARPALPVHRKTYLVGSSQLDAGPLCRNPSRKTMATQTSMRGWRQLHEHTAMPWGRQPVGNVRDNRGVHMLCRFVLVGRRRSIAREEQVIVGVVDADRHVREVGQAGLPACEVFGDGHLVVAAALEDKDGLAQLRGGGDRVVAAKVQPVRGG